MKGNFEEANYPPVFESSYLYNLKRSTGRSVEPSFPIVNIEMIHLKPITKKISFRVLSKKPLINLPIPTKCSTGG